MTVLDGNVFDLLRDMSRRVARALGCSPISLPLQCTTMDLALLDPELGRTGNQPVASTSYGAGVSDDDADDRGESELSWGENDDDDDDYYYDEQDQVQDNGMYDLSGLPPLPPLPRKRRRQGAGQGSDNAFGTIVEPRSTRQGTKTTTSAHRKGKGRQQNQHDDYQGAMMNLDDQGWLEGDDDDGDDFYQEPQEGEEFESVLSHPALVVISNWLTMTPSRTSVACSVLSETLISQSAVGLPWTVHLIALSKMN